MRCQDQRRWRLLAEDIPRVPPAELPEGWGARGAVLEEARRLIVASRQERHPNRPQQQQQAPPAGADAAQMQQPPPPAASGEGPLAMLFTALETMRQKAPAIAVAIAIAVAAANELGWLPKH
jgi:hypothetical protein